MSDVLKYLTKYLEKSKDTVDDIVLDSVEVNEKGFISFLVRNDKKLVVFHVYGDGKYWQSRLEEIAKQNGCNVILTSTRRSPKSYARKYGYGVVGYVLEKRVN